MRFALSVDNLPISCSLCLRFSVFDLCFGENDHSGFEEDHSGFKERWQQYSNDNNNKSQDTTGNEALYHQAYQLS
jgi:hypothetical protein